MTTAMELKKLAVQVKRTDSTLRQIASQLTLGDQERRVLLAAASILHTHGRQLDVEVARERRAEEAKERAIAKSTQEAAASIADWPVVTMLDKIAFCIAAGFESNLRLDIQDQRADLAWSLDYWVKQARHDIPAELAWQSWRQQKPVSELVAQARERLERIRTRPGTVALAQRWQVRLQADKPNL